MGRPTVDYEQHGRTYARHREPDPRIAARIHAALGDATTVLNVGAGAGSYEPTDRRVLAVERRTRPGPRAEDRIVDRLDAALKSGAWDAEHGHLRDLAEYDGALRLVISEPAP